MGLEALGSVISSVATAVGSAGRAGAGAIETGTASVSLDSIGISGLARMDTNSAFGATPAVAKSGLAGLGPVLEAPVNSTFSDRTAVSMEGFKPMGIADLVTPPGPGGTFKPVTELNPIGSARGFNPVGEIMFNQEPVNATSPLDTTDVLAGVESILSRARINGVQEQVSLPEIDVAAEIVIPGTESAVAPLVVPDIQGYPRPQIGISPALESVTKTENALGIQTVRQVVTGSATSVETAPAVSTQPATQEQEVEEVVEEIIQEKTDMVEEEEIERIRRKYVVDESALSQVVMEVKQAVVKAKELAKKLGIRLTGKLIGMFVPGQHEGNESEAVKGVGPDGSIPERQQSIESLGEFFSEVQAEEKVVREAYEKPPVKIRPEGQGQPVKDEDVARVFRHRTVKLIEKAYEEVVRRVIKKKLVSVSRPVMAPALVSEKKEVKTEQTLEELNPQLAGVFQKAA